MGLPAYLRRKKHLQRETDELQEQLRLAREERDRLELMVKGQRAKSKGTQAHD